MREEQQVPLNFKSIVDSIYKVSESSFVELEEIVELIEYPKGYILSEEGHVERYIYFLSKGMVRAYTIRNGEERTFWFGMEGCIVCSMKNYVEKKPSYESIDLLENTSFYRVLAEDLELLYEQNIEWANWGRKYIEHEIIKTENRLIEQLFLSATERYHLLIENNPVFLQRIPLGIIASYLGITQVSLSRIRAKS